MTMLFHMRLTEQMLCGNEDGYEQHINIKLVLHYDQNSGSPVHFSQKFLSTSKLCQDDNVA